jgi:hypothetical protein
MKLMLTLCVMLTFMVAGCGEEKNPEKMNTKELTHEKQASVDRDEKEIVSEQTTASSDDVKVTIKPHNPVVGDCLEARYQGKRSGKTFAWEVDGIVQTDESTRYCLEDAQRDAIVSVTISDGNSSGTVYVTVGNSPPRIVDTSINLIVDGGEASLEITPTVEDADGDFVSLEYQWLINGVVNEQHTGNRLPSEAYKQDDTVQITIIPDDDFDKGPTYQTRNINVPSAAPMITSLPPKSFEALEYTYQVKAIDVDGGELSFSLEDEPEGMTIDAETGMINWPLTEISAGEYQIKIVVTDPDGSTGSQEFTLNLEKRRPSKQVKE